VAVFPANIKMFADHVHEGFSVVTVALFLRLPLQVVFIVIVDKLTRTVAVREGSDARVPDDGEGASQK
jgi:uncharacterized membrane protein